MVARTLVCVLTMFDVQTNLRSAAAIGRLMYRMDKRHRRRTHEHLRLAFPEISAEQRDDLACRSFEHFVQLLIEICHTPRLIHRDGWAARMRLVRLGGAIEIFNSGKPAIMITGHVGNWEVLGYLLAVLGVPLHAIARPLDNPLISDWLYGQRQRRGMQIITKWGATQRMLNVLDGGGNLGFVADQNAGDKGLFVPFFGKLASTYKSIGLLAMERRIAIVCGYAHRLDGRFQYELGTTDIIYPDDWQRQPDPLYYITARYMRAIELMITRQPDQYLWMHRRWKSRPRFERAGKPMPAGLRKNIEQLPWMNESLFERIVTPASSILGP